MRGEEGVTRQRYYRLDPPTLKLRLELDLRFAAESFWDWAAGAGYWPCRVMVMSWHRHGRPATVEAEISKAHGRRRRWAKQMAWDCGLGPKDIVCGDIAWC